MKAIGRIMGRFLGQSSQRRPACGLCGSSEAAVRLRQPPWVLWQCARCGVWFSLPETGPPPSFRSTVDSEFRELTWSRKPYIDSMEEFIEYHDPLLARLDEWVPRGRLLDVGCGPGFCMEAARRRGWNVVGVEPEGFPATYAAEKLGMEVVQTTLEDAAFPEGSFDAVLMIHSIEHVTDPMSTMAAVRSVLRPEGVVFVETPNAECEASRFFGDDWQYLNLPEHAFIFDPATVALLFRRTGLRVLELQAPVRMANPHGAALWAWAERPGPPRHPTAGRRAT